MSLKIFEISWNHQYWGGGEGGVIKTAFPRFYFLLHHTIIGGRGGGDG